MMAKTIWIALGCSAVLASITIASRAEPYHHRHSLAYSDRPAYWGVERRRRIYTDCCGWRWTELHPGEASIRQVNPRLRARSDGRLLEEVGTPPQPPEIVVIWPDSSSSGSAAIIPLGLPMACQARASHPALAGFRCPHFRRVRLFEKGALRSNPNRNELRCLCAWPSAARSNKLSIYLPIGVLQNKTNFNRL